MGCKKEESVMAVFGCSLTELRAHIQSSFLPGMNWGNYGAYKKGADAKWCVDHIVPCAVASSAEAMKQLFHYTNLRAFWSKPNCEKSDFLPCGARARYKRTPPVMPTA